MSPTHTPRSNRRNLVSSECCVCSELLTVSAGQPVIRFTCGHCAHEDCCHEWLKQSSDPHQTCPECDAPLEIESGGGSRTRIEALIQNLKRRHAEQERQAALSQLDRSSPQHLQRGHTAQGFAGSKSLQKDIHETSSEASAPSLVESRHVQEYVESPKKVTAKNKNPIPMPTLTLRSEYARLSPMNQKQTLACVVTVEVPQSNWKAHAEDAVQPRRLADTRSVLSKESDVSAENAAVEAQQQDLERVAEALKERINNFHGLNPAKFGSLHTHGRLEVSRDQRGWQFLDCYLFSNMMICACEKRTPSQLGSDPAFAIVKYSLKGSVNLKNHLDSITSSPDQHVLTMHLGFEGLPEFNLRFTKPSQMLEWKRKLENILAKKRLNAQNLEDSAVEMFELPGAPITPYIHAPLDVVVVVPVSPSTHEIKLSEIRDTLRFLVHSLGPHDRLGIVTYGGSEIADVNANLCGSRWPGWEEAIGSIKAARFRGARCGLDEGANVAMDIMMHRKTLNLANVLMISDSTASDTEKIDFVVERAEAAKVSFFCFGFGAAHRPDTLVELATRTKGSYVYVKEWTHLRDLIAGCVGSLQSTSHQSATLKLSVPSGVMAKFQRVSGALRVVHKRSAGRDVEVELGDLRFGDRRDVLVELLIEPDDSYAPVASEGDDLDQSLNALRSPSDSSSSSPNLSPTTSIEELPVLQADLTFGNLLRSGTITQLPNPSLLTVTVLPKTKLLTAEKPWPQPPRDRHPMVVQRRMELLTSEMLASALRKVGKGKYDEAQQLLRSTQALIRRFDSLGHVVTPAQAIPAPKPAPIAKLPPRPTSIPSGRSPIRPRSSPVIPAHPAFIERQATPTIRVPTPEVLSPMTAALDAVLSAGLVEIIHPSVFLQDHRKAVLQAIGVISSQRGYSDRSAIEAMWAQRIEGTVTMLEASRHWRETREQQANGAAHELE